MISGLRSVLQTVRLWHERRMAVRALSALNDYQLADIGVERGCILEAVSGNLSAR